MQVSIPPKSRVSRHRGRRRSRARAVRRSICARHRELAVKRVKASARKPMSRGAGGEEFSPGHSRYDFTPDHRAKTIPGPRKTPRFCITPRRSLLLARLATNTPRRANRKRTRNYSWDDRQPRASGGCSTLPKRLELPLAHTPTACSTTTAPSILARIAQEATSRRSWPHQFGKPSRVWSPTSARHPRVTRLARNEKKRPLGWMGPRLRDSSDAPSPKEALHLPHGLALDTSRSGCERAQGRSCLCPTRSSQRLPNDRSRKHQRTRICDMCGPSTRCSINAETIRSCATSRSTPTCSASLSGATRAHSRSNIGFRHKTAGPVGDPAGEIAEFCQFHAAGIIPGS